MSSEPTRTRFPQTDTMGFGSRFASRFASRFGSRFASRFGSKFGSRFGSPTSRDLPWPPMTSRDLTPYPNRGEIQDLLAYFRICLSGNSRICRSGNFRICHSGNSRIWYVRFHSLSRAKKGRQTLCLATLFWVEQTACTTGCARHDTTKSSRPEFL